MGLLAAASLSSAGADFKIDTNATWNLPGRNSQGILFGYYPCLESLSSSVSNAVALSYVSEYCKDFFHGRTIEDKYDCYRKGKNSFLVRLAGIFSPYEIKSEKKNPADVIESFFATSRTLRENFYQGLQGDFGKKFLRVRECRALLQQEFETLELLFDWTSTLAKENSARGHYFRNVLAKKGVYHAEFLVQDLHMIKENVLRWYDTDPIGTVSTLFGLEKK